ncbi:MAG: abortive infection family protein [Acidimicrobiia bacterium]|nr:abortive infection family protein [Acidimicrobiia bacterium]MCY4458722.1 abortive infection family protein [Acidimicrobiaceae bacterium]
MAFYKLDIPEGLGSKYVASINKQVERLDLARESQDLSDFVGRSKELVECVARVVIGIRKLTLSDNADFGSVVTQAHKAVDRQPGRGHAGSDPAVKKMAQAAKNLVSELGNLRNSVGTGHGRATLPPVVEEQALIAVDATVVWTRWILGRLDSYLRSDVKALIESLCKFDTFVKGELTKRLDEINLLSLWDKRAQELGVAIGRRSAKGTFNVQEEGVDRAISSPEQFPTAYREGLLTGLLLTETGMLNPVPSSVELVVELLLVDENLNSRLDKIAPLIEFSGWFVKSRSSVPTPQEITEAEFAAAQVTKAAIAATKKLPKEARKRRIKAWQKSPSVNSWEIGSPESRSSPLQTNRRK